MGLDPRGREVGAGVRSTCGQAQTLERSGGRRGWAALRVRASAIRVGAWVAVGHGAQATCRLPSHLALKLDTKVWASGQCAGTHHAQVCTCVPWSGSAGSGSCWMRAGRCTRWTCPRWAHHLIMHACLRACACACWL